MNYFHEQLANLELAACIGTYASSLEACNLVGVHLNLLSATLKYVQHSEPCTRISKRGTGAAAFSAAGPGPVTRKTSAAPDRQRTQEAQISVCGDVIAWKALNFPIWTQTLLREAA